MKSRIRVAAALLLTLLLFGMLFSIYGASKTWSTWNVPSMTPNFADLRSITNGAESYAKGVDPILANPADPWQRRQNYPRIWQSLYLLGVNQSHTSLIATILIAFFLTGVLLILPNPNYFTLFCLMVAVLSPAALLCVERGNIDLLMFFLVAVAIVAIQSRPFFRL